MKIQIISNCTTRRRHIEYVSSITDQINNYARNEKKTVHNKPLIIMVLKNEFKIVICNIRTRYLRVYE